MIESAPGVDSPGKRSRSAANLLRREPRKGNSCLEICGAITCTPRWLISLSKEAGGLTACSAVPRYRAGSIRKAVVTREARQIGRRKEAV